MPQEEERQGFQTTKLAPYLGMPYLGQERIAAIPEIVPDEMQDTLREL
jgi:hypothetical protein